MDIFYDKKTVLAKHKDNETKVTQDCSGKNDIFENTTSYYISCKAWN